MKSFKYSAVITPAFGGIKASAALFRDKFMVEVSSGRVISILESKFFKFAARDHSSGTIIKAINGNKRKLRL